jgi:TolB-like protein
MSKFFNELKRRNVLKETIAYLVIAWFILQVVDVVMPIWNAPGWILQVITITLALGLPLWVLFSWNYEISTSGIKKTTTTSNDQSKNTKLSTGLNTLIMVAIIGIIALIWIKPDLVSSKVSSTNLVVLNNSIAVLPFDDMSSGGDTEWFCDGVTEDILTNLSKLKDLKVISRTSTERYKNTDKSIPEIAAELGVSYVVEGSVRKHEDKIIITAQLIDANDNHVWAQNYNDVFKEVFKIQQDVSQKIVNQLKIAISPEEEKEMNKLPTESIEAYKLVLQGRNFIDKGTLEYTLIAKKLFEQAIELDPNYADAYADLANATSNRYHDGTLTRKQRNKLAMEHLNKAISLDINCHRAYAFKGALYNYQGNPILAKENLEKALAINPNDVMTHRMFIYYYSRGITRDIKKETYHIDKGLKLEPFNISFIHSKIRNLILEENIEAAEILLEEKKSLIPENRQRIINHLLVRARALASTKLHKDQNEYFKFYEEAINTFPEDAAYYYIQLAITYDCVLNDDEGYVKYTKIAYDLEPDNIRNGSEYLYALVEAGQFERAMEVFESKNYKNLSDEVNKLQSLYSYYYIKRDYEMARSTIENKDFPKSVFKETMTFAQLGDRKTVDSLLALPLISSSTKAFVFAIYKERDSMYYYLNNIDFTIYNAQVINSRHEFDPYRKEPRYIEFLKKYYFPVDQQKN